MEDLILLEALTLMVVSYAHFAVSITQEICASPIPLCPIPLGPIRLRFSPSLAVRFVCICGGRGQLASGGDWKYARLARLRRATAGLRMLHLMRWCVVACRMPHGVRMLYAAGSILGIHCFRITPRPVEPALPVEPDTVITAQHRQPQRDASPRRRPPAGAGRMKQIH
jgi:hypothetical protein